MCVAAAIGGAAAIGAYGANKAANTQAAAQGQAAQTQQNMFNTIQQNGQPFMQAGYGATKSLTDLLGTTGTPGSTATGTTLPVGYLNTTFDPNSLDANPAYQFALKTGGQATRNADTPGVGALSGAALKDLTAFNVGTANQYENQYFTQDQTQKNAIYSRLAGIAGLGQNAAAGVGNNGATLGTGVAQAQAGAGGSLAAGTIGTANALGGAANNLAGLMYLNAGGPGGNATNGSGLGFSGYSPGFTSNANSGAVGIGPPAPGTGG